MAKLSIVSWNINGLRAVMGKGLLDFLKSQSADVYCFQEIKCFEDQLAEDLKNALALQGKAHWHSAKRPGYSGVMTLSDSDFEKTEIGYGVEKFDDEGRVLIHDMGKFELLNCYFPNGGASEDRHFFKMEFLEDFLKFLKKRQKKKPLILTGDINIAHTEQDIHDPVRLDGESGFKPEEREWMDRLVSAGFVDAFRHFEPESKEVYSWWSYRAGARQRNKGWRIDYFLVSEELIPNLCSMKYLPKVTGSDHCPLRLDLEV